MIVTKVMTKAIYKLAQAMIFLECVYRLVRCDVVKTKLGHPFYTFTSYLSDFIKAKERPFVCPAFAACPCPSSRSVN
jgi:hypothetical protein